jgi:hypothetical protein
MLLWCIIVYAISIHYRSCSLYIRKLLYYIKPEQILQKKIGDTNHNWNSNMLMLFNWCEFSITANKVQIWAFIILLATKYELSLYVYNWILLFVKWGVNLLSRKLQSKGFRSSPFGEKMAISISCVKIKMYSKSNENNKTLSSSMELWDSHWPEFPDLIPFVIHTVAPSPCVRPRWAITSFFIFIF